MSNKGVIVPFEVDVVEENAIAAGDVGGLAVVDGLPVGEKFNPGVNTLCVESNFDGESI